MIFNVEVTETLRRVYQVTADTSDEATDYVRARRNAEEEGYVLTADDFFDCEITAEEAE